MNLVLATVDSLVVPTAACFLLLAVVLVLLVVGCSFICSCVGCWFHQSRKRNLEDISDPCPSKVENSKQRKSHNLSCENLSASVPVKVKCIFGRVVPAVVNLVLSTVVGLAVPTAAWFLLLAFGLVVLAVGCSCTCGCVGCWLHQSRKRS